MDKQILKYYNILYNKTEERRVLLLISPDYNEPKIVQQIERERDICSIKWISWTSVYNWLNNEMKYSKVTKITNYLISELIEYMELLNLVQKENTKLFENEKYDSKLKYVLGNKTAEKVLLNIFHFKETYANKIARNLNIPVNGVQQQLKRFEKGGILKKEKKNKVVLYSFNSKNPFIEEIYEMLGKVYRSIPLEEKNRIFIAENIL